MSEKKKVNSKNKGNTFERKISTMLSARFQEKTGLVTAFRRNIDSGSFFGGSNQARKQTHSLDKATFGDIVCPDDFKFSIECKHYKDPPSMTMLINQDWKLLDKWLDQAEQDGVNSGKSIAIIAKFNNVPEIIIVDHLPHNMKSVINYKSYFIVPLADFIALPDDVFFE